MNVSVFDEGLMDKCVKFWVLCYIDGIEYGERFVVVAIFNLGEDNALMSRDDEKVVRCQFFSEDWELIEDVGSYEVLRKSVGVNGIRFRVIRFGLVDGNGSKICFRW